MDNNLPGNELMMSVNMPYGVDPVDTFDGEEVSEPHVPSVQRLVEPFAAGPAPLAREAHSALPSRLPPHCPASILPVHTAAINTKANMAGV